MNTSAELTTLNQFSSQFYTDCFTFTSTSLRPSGIKFKKSYDLISNRYVPNQQKQNTLIRDISVRTPEKGLRVPNSLIQLSSIVAKVLSNTTRIAFAVNNSGLSLAADQTYVSDCITKYVGRSNQFLSLGRLVPIAAQQAASSDIWTSLLKLLTSSMASLSQQRYTRLETLFRKPPSKLISSLRKGPISSRIMFNIIQVSMWPKILNPLSFYLLLIEL